MTWRTRVVVASGLAAVVAGLALAVFEPAPIPPDSPDSAATILAGIGVLLVAGSLLWRARGRRTPADQRAPAAPWTGASATLDRAPERTPPAETLAGDALGRQIEEACRVAEEEEGTVAAGLATVRPTLRAATREVLVAAGSSPTGATTALDEGEWTDDRVAASVLSREVAPPSRSLRERLRAWLFPERVVRSRVGRAVAAIDGAAAALPPVPGQDAPRTKPIAPPRLETLAVGPDGSLRRGAADDSPVATDDSPVATDDSPVATDRSPVPGDGSPGHAEEGATGTGDQPAPADGRTAWVREPGNGREEP